jgi:hypothetical protein
MGESIAKASGPQLDDLHGIDTPAHMERNMRAALRFVTFIAVLVAGILAVNFCWGQDCDHRRDAYRATAPKYQGGRRIDFNFGFTPYAAPYAVPVQPYYQPVQPGYYTPVPQYAPVPQYQPPAIQFRTRNGFQFYIPLQKNPYYKSHKKGHN